MKGLVMSLLVAAGGDVIDAMEEDAVLKNLM